MSRLIDADLLYMQLQKDEELARKRVLDTESFLPYPNNMNPSYTRYVAQMDERTRLKHMVADAPTIEPERKKDVIQKFHDYQVEWLLSHCDLELEPQLEEWVVRFLHDTANCYMMEIDREEGEQDG